MFTYSGGKGEYIVWSETDGEVRSYGTMSRSMDSGKMWRIFPDGFGASYIAEGKTRDAAIAALTEAEGAPKTAADALTEIETIIIDGDAALQALMEAVSERGSNFVYRNRNSGTIMQGPNDGVARGFAPSLAESYVCRYEWKGCASCGVGVALSKLGMTIDELRALDKPNPDAFNGTSIAHVVFPDRVEVSQVALDVFNVFQRAQDDGKSWGPALQLARDALRV